MANFWRFARYFRIKSGRRFDKWPSVLTITVELQPDDYFGVDKEGLPRTSIASSFKTEFDERKRRIFIKDAVMPEAIDYSRLDDLSSLDLDGNIARFSFEVENARHASFYLHWVTHDFIQSLSIHIGIYFEITSIHAMLGDEELAMDNSVDNISLTIAIANTQVRRKAMDWCFILPQPNNLSYRRLEVGSRYFCHALRLISPRQVSFSPTTVHAEVMLNLAKCLETIFATDRRETYREYFRKLGISETAIETQLIPITLIRNELDVGHPSSGSSTPDEVAIVREFVNRSIHNVTGLLQLVLDRVWVDKDFLKPLSEDGSGDRAKFIKRLETYLKEPSLGDQEFFFSIGMILKDE